MHIEQREWAPTSGWLAAKAERVGKPGASVVFAFASKEILKHPECFDALGGEFPGATLIGCSTAGEIVGMTVRDDSLCATVVSFEHTSIRFARAGLPDESHSRESGRQIARSLRGDGLVSVFVLSDGLQVNGSELVKGLTEELPRDVTVIGGLAADGSRFHETLVLSRSGIETNAIVAVGFYGDRLKVGRGSLGGWDPFGPYRRITRARGNVLYELDGKSALGLYKRYLGRHADALPSAGFFFPLCVRRSRDGADVVRTVLAVDEHEQSMTFAGDMPEGGYAQLMRANVDRLVDGAVGAARAAIHPAAEPPSLALLISCAGRRMVLRQRVEEEVEAVGEVLGEKTVLSGFYSYGEIAPSVRGGPCELHNQTMTLVTLSES